MKPIKVNGVVVCCSNCINHQVSPLDEPCKDCWKAIFHSGNIDEVRLDDIVFYPADKERFLTLEKMVKKYKDQFAAMKADAKAHGISIEELCKACEFKSHYPHHGALLTNMTGARLPANGFPIESTPVMTK